MTSNVVPLSIFFCYNSRNSVQDALAQPIVTQGNFQAFHLGEENSRHPAFSDLVSGNEIDDPEAVGFQNMREPSVHWGSGSPYLTPAHDDLNSSFSPNLPPVLEEPSSSFSEGKMLTDAFSYY